MRLCCPPAGCERRRTGPARDVKEHAAVSIYLTRFSLLLGWAMILGACGPQIVYEYTPPATPEGRMCVAQCLNGRNLCEQMAESTHRHCQMNYDLALQNYNACEANKGKNCIRPSLCPSAFDARCQSNYRDCFTLCGGQVKAVVVQ